MPGEGVADGLEAGRVLGGSDCNPAGRGLGAGDGRTACRGVAAAGRGVAAEYGRTAWKGMSVGDAVGSESGRTDGGTNGLSGFCAL